MIRKIRICSIIHQPGWFKSRPEVFAQFIYVTGILRFRPGVDELIAKINQEFCIAIVLFPLVESVIARAKQRRSIFVENRLALDAIPQTGKQPFGFRGKRIDVVRR